MSSLLNTNTAWNPYASTPDYTANAILGDLSFELATANSSRLSKGSGPGQRAGNAMRVTKPRSANNSPRSTLLQSRRRTLIGENLQGFQGRLPPQTVDMSYLPNPASEVPNLQAYTPEKRSARPVSWHPTTHQLGHSQTFQHQQTTFYPLPTYADAEVLSNYQQYPPTPAVYSGYNSPSSNFSPLSLPYSHIDSEHFYPTATQAFPTQQASRFQPNGHSRQNSPGRSAKVAYQSGPESVRGGLDWKSFATQGGFIGSSTPPTPEDFNQCQQPEMKLAAEDSIPFQPLEDEESEGEILYGMGLYDAPEKSVGDATLGLHTSTIFSLFGSAGTYPEPTGKGLKLEDAWEPPASDDEGESGEGEEDAEGYDQDN
ncbi:hypothetical protein B0H66DRAFT_529531 [Apodospora peruviana]|uniref:Uncharacterized protein n=1 Tax=Apodospora peruviana TaxID=516989 RepID=A0AAE0IIR5_9PEZI|nr:hypothetical protein B0H66DRAFT_529531 [Apodospora peruviana]